MLKIQSLIEGGLRLGLVLAVGAPLLGCASAAWGPRPSPARTSPPGPAIAPVSEARIATLFPSRRTECLERGDKGRWKSVRKNLVINDGWAELSKTICYLEFSLGSIPPDAIFTAAALRLVQAGRQASTNPHVIQVDSIERKGWESLQEEALKGKLEEKALRSKATLGKRGTIRSPKAKDGVVDVWRWPRPGTRSKQAIATTIEPTANEVPERIIALLLSPRPRSESGRSYNAFTGETDTGQSDGRASDQPRLILTYTVTHADRQPSTEPDPGWQSDGWVAIRSPRTFLPEPNVPVQESYKAMPVVRGGTRIASYTAAVFGGSVYVARQRADKVNNRFDWYLDAQDALGRDIWSKKLPPTHGGKARVVVDSTGRLTLWSKVASEQSRFIVYQLNTAQPDECPEELETQVVRGVKTPAALLAAPGGNLFLIDETDVVALNSGLQLLWRTHVGLSEKIRMTLSPDGRFLYVVGMFEGKHGKQEPGLLAINAQTGSSPPRYPLAGATSFHHPVVIRHPDGPDYVYIAANSVDGGWLTTLRNEGYGKFGDRIAVLEKVHEEAGLFGQPAPASSAIPVKDLSTKKLHVVWQEDLQEPAKPARLVSINALTGKIENRSALPLEDSKGRKVSLRGSELWSGGNLALDAGGTVLLWENGTLYVYGADGGRLFATSQIQQLLPNGLPPKKLPEKLELLFGSDGTLYARDRKDGSLFALLPTYTLPLESAQQTISSPTHLWIDGVVDGGEQVLSAEGQIILGAGFRVKKGAILRAGVAGRSRDGGEKGAPSPGVCPERDDAAPNETTAGSARQKE